jgi:transposase
MRQWVIRYNNTRSFNAEDNKTDEEKRIKELEKKVKHNRLENLRDIAKKIMFKFFQKHK